MLLPPIVAWLIFKKRQALASIKITTSVIGFLALLFISFLWFMARLSGVNVAEQFFVLVFPTFIVMSLWGSAGVKLLAFPLLFLLFAVPVGDFLIPYLQFVTADISVFMLELLNIPVYRDGMFIQIPNGNFLVAEACSGIRFLISTFTIGVLFAYLNIRSVKRRSLFIFLCLVVPILGNGLRAFLMILIGHLSNMKAAVGFDHLVYGWLFFSVILVILFILGHYIAEPIISEEQPIKKVEAASESKIPFSRLFMILIALSIGPAVYSMYMDKAEQYGNEALPFTTEVKSTSTFNNWQPNYLNADKVFFKSEVDGTVSNELFVIEYLFEEENKELISGQNEFFDKNIWSLDSIDNGGLLDEKGNKLPYTEYRIVNLKGQERIIRVIYVVAGEKLSSKIEVKIHQLISKLLLKDLGGQALIFSTIDVDDGAKRLSDFMIKEIVALQSNPIRRIK